MNTMFPTSKLPSDQAESVHVAVAPGLLQGEHAVCREAGDTDADYEGRKTLLAAVLQHARTG